MASTRAKTDVLRVLIFTAALAGCVQLLDIEQLPLDEAAVSKDGGGDERGSSETGSPASDASDASVDSFIPPVDDAGPCPFVDNAIACDDFDTATSRCNVPPASNGSAVETSAAFAISPDRVLRVAANGDAGAFASAGCTMTQYFTAPFDAWEVSTFFRPTTSVGTEGYALLLVRFTGSNDAGTAPYAYIEVVSATARIIFADNVAETVYGTTFPFPLDTWSKLALRFDSASGTMTLLRNDVALSTENVSTARISKTILPTFTAGYWGDVSQPHAFDLDNFTVRRLP